MQTSPALHDQALWAALAAPGLYDRMAAVAILANFGEADPTWWTLLDVVREQDGPVRGLAAGILRALPVRADRPVNWRPAAPALHAILNGTGMSDVPHIVSMLVAHRVSSELAVPLLGGGGGHALLSYASAEQRSFREGALALLRALRGEDLGRDLAVWRSWVRGLPAP
jgi:hypothetical protein